MVLFLERMRSQWPSQIELDAVYILHVTASEHRDVNLPHQAR